ncbi:dynein regulatory complex protein 1-like [Apostichopus japonicus]|uniref:dynein regulatory complex protein 1-like n=1 Tax=Stichopus japonicus TaxID=307972 RepID=UPI003AB1ABFB
MNPHEEDEDSGPTVDSNDAEERIAARRIRIAKRIEVARREAMGEDPNAKKKEAKEEQSKSRRQVEDSRQRLSKLTTDGFELVSNVEVAANSREAQRRAEEEETVRLRIEKLDAEAKASLERFEEITKRWSTASGRNIPQELHDVLMQQKQLCDAMIDEKNKLINDFQMELKAKDDQYVKDLKKQAEDVDLMIERMEEQIKNLMKAYRDEITQIEKAFELERRELLNGNKRKWDQAVQARGDQELDYMKQRDKRVDDYEQQIQHLRIQDAEEYNQVKIKLETDVQVLEQQLQQMKATYQLNQEKLEYNFQVLKKRDEENTITKSQQKRKLTRLQDVMNNMRIKLAKQEKQYREENQNLADDYKRITEQFKELQKKSKHFQATDTKKFYDVWCMNEEEVKQLAQKLLEQNRIITEQQLGLEATPLEDLSFMENVGPLSSDKSEIGSASAHEVLKEVMSTEGSVQEAEESTDLETETKDPTSKLSSKAIKSVLELLCDESGFLVESKLNQLLAPLEKDERSLMKLDAIFGALGIDTEEDIHKLAAFFLRMRQGSLDTSGGQLVESVTMTTSKPGSEQPTSGEIQQTATSDVTGAAVDIESKQEDASSVHSSSLEAGPLIHPNDVFKALRTFAEENRTPLKEKSKYQTFKIISGEERDVSGDTDYWMSYPKILSEGKEKVWSALLEGLEKYSTTLTEWSKLITETDGLRQQNAELRMLLHQYINSKVNQELEIPPTRVLNLNV